MNFLKRIFSPTILTISFLLLIYTYYKSEIIWGGNSRYYYKTYYLISLTLICFSVITFFISDKIKQYLIISFISLIVSLYLLEGYLIFKKKHSNNSLKEQLYEKQTGNKWDKRDILNIYKDLKLRNNNITIAVFPKYFSLSGISNSETIFCNENGYYSIYQSDRYGFNNPDNEWDSKKIEYLLVGDSFTHGACVNRPNDISSVLRNLSGKSVLNLGMGGNGPLAEYATLREYLNKKVKKVLWIYFEGNDLRDLATEKKNSILINYLKDLNFTQNLKNKQNYIDSILSNEIKEKEKAANIIKFIKIHNLRFLIYSALTPLEGRKAEFQEILQLTKKLTDKYNSKLYFIYLPEYSHFKTSYDNTNYNLVKESVKNLNIPFIDIYKEVFKNEQNPLNLFPFKLPGHYNVNGYKKVAETIYKFTKN